MDLCREAIARLAAEPPDARAQPASSRVLDEAEGIAGEHGTGCVRGLLQAAPDASAIRAIQRPLGRASHPRHPVMDERVWHVPRAYAGSHQAPLHVRLVTEAGSGARPEVLAESAGPAEIGGERRPVEAEEERLGHQLRQVRGPPATRRQRQELAQPARRRFFVVGLDGTAEKMPGPRLARRRRVRLDHLRRQPDIIVEKDDQAVVDLRQRPVERPALVPRRFEQIARIERDRRRAHHALGVSAVPVLHDPSACAARRLAAPSQGRQRSGEKILAIAGRQNDGDLHHVTPRTQGAQPLRTTACGVVRTNSNPGWAARNSSTAVLQPP